MFLIYSFNKAARYLTFRYYPPIVYVNEKVSKLEKYLMKNLSEYY